MRSGDYQAAVNDYEYLKAMGHTEVNSKLSDCRRKVAQRPNLDHSLDHYGILGVSTNSTPAQIKQAYRFVHP